MKRGTAASTELTDLRQLQSESGEPMVKGEPVPLRWRGLPRFGAKRRIAWRVVVRYPTHSTILKTPLSVEDVNRMAETFRPPRIHPKTLARAERQARKDPRIGRLLEQRLIVPECWHLYWRGTGYRGEYHLLVIDSNRSRVCYCLYGSTGELTATIQGNREAISDALGDDWVRLSPETLCKRLGYFAGSDALTS